MSSMVKPRSSSSRVMFYAGCEDIYTHHQPYFLESCFLCHKHLGPNNDIFMYRGNTPFCSEECRQEQIEIDDTKERSRNISTHRALRKADTPTKSESNKKPVQTGTVIVA